MHSLITPTILVNMVWNICTSTGFGRKILVLKLAILATYRLFHLAVSTISSIISIILGNIGSIGIRPKYRYCVIFQTLLVKDSWPVRYLWYALIFGKVILEVASIKCLQGVVVSWVACLEAFYKLLFRIFQFTCNPPFTFLFEFWKTNAVWILLLICFYGRNIFLGVQVSCQFFRRLLLLIWLCCISS